MTAVKRLAFKICKAVRFCPSLGRGGALLRPAESSEFSRIYGETASTYPFRCRGRCPHRPTEQLRIRREFRKNLVQSAGGQSRPPLQERAKVVVGADDSVRPLGNHEFAVACPKPPLAAPRAGRGGGIFEENDGGDLFQVFRVLRNMSRSNPISQLC